MLRVQRYVNDIRKIVEKTEIYCREMGIVGKYLKMNTAITYPTNFLSPFFMKWCLFHHLLFFYC